MSLKGRQQKAKHVRIKGQPGRVVGTAGRRVVVRDEAGERVCYLSGQRAVVGDRVRWEEAPGTGGKLGGVEERERVLMRRDLRGKERLLAANLKGIIIVVTPERTSPLRMARLMGAAPRYFGKREECKLIQNCLGTLSRASRSICPKATTMM